MLDKLDTSTLGFPNAFPFQVSLGLRKLWLCHFVFLTWTWKQPRGAFCAGAPSLLSAKRSINLGKTWQNNIPKRSKQPHRNVARWSSKATWNRSKDVERNLKVPMPTFIFYHLSGKHAENIQYKFWGIAQE